MARIAARSFSLVLLLVAWELIARSGKVTPFMLPPFSAVLVRIYDDAASGVLWTNLGLTLFLAQVGMSSGPKFAATVTQYGFVMLGMGAAVLAALVLPIMILGLFVFRMPYDEVAGIVAGACGNPAILAYSNKLAPTDKPDIGYAMIFPGMTIVKILFVDVVAKLF